MSNCITHAQSGDNSAILELWLKEQPFVQQQVRSFYYSHQGTCDQKGIALDDLMQEAYFIFLSALKDEKQTESFERLGTLGIRMRCRLYNLIGLRSDKSIRFSVLDNAQRYDAKVNEDSDTTLLELLCITDENNDYDTIEDKVFQESLHAVLDNLLGSLPKLQQKILMLEFYQGLTSKDIAAKTKVTQKVVFSERSKAFQTLRSSASLERLRPYAEILGISQCFDVAVVPVASDKQRELEAKLRTQLGLL